MPRPRVTLRRNGITSSWPSGPPKDENRIASKGLGSPRRVWVGEAGTTRRGAPAESWSVGVTMSVMGVPRTVGSVSGEKGGDVLEGIEAASGVEGELIAHVQARIGVAQVAHHADEVVQIIALEGE